MIGNMGWECFAKCKLQAKKAFAGIVASVIGVAFTGVTSGFRTVLTIELVQVHRLQ